MHILIIDDDDDAREVMGLILREQGYDVEAAVDGADALARLRTMDRPEVILLDMMMPRVDGEHFLSAMKRDKKLMDIPVYIISGHPAAREMADALGAAGCLVKPIELDQILAAIGRIASRRSARN
jgi:CheY-like chemotaxis protein